MKALNRRQRAFVVAVLELGSTNYTRAAYAAGYEGDGSVVKVTAHRLAHDEKVLAAMNEEGRRRLHASAPMAISELIKIAEGTPPFTTAKDKLKAIEMILNRTGHSAVTQHEVKVEHTVTDQVAVRRIYTLAKAQGMDPVKLLGSHGVKIAENGDIIDADFAEVGDEDQVEADDEAGASVPEDARRNHLVVLKRRTPDDGDGSDRAHEPTTGNGLTDGGEPDGNGNPGENEGASTLVEPAPESNDRPGDGTSVFDYNEEDDDNG